MTCKSICEKREEHAGYALRWADSWFLSAHICIAVTHRKSKHRQHCCDLHVTLMVQGLPYPTGLT